MISVRELKIAIATETYTDEIKELLSIFSDCVISHNVYNKMVFFIKNGMSFIRIQYYVDYIDIDCSYSYPYFKTRVYSDDIDELIKFLMGYYFNVCYDCMHIDYINDLYRHTSYKNRIILNKEELLKLIKKSIY